MLYLQAEPSRRAWGTRIPSVPAKISPNEPIFAANSNGTNHLSPSKRSRLLRHRPPAFRYFFLQSPFRP